MLSAARARTRVKGWLFKGVLLFSLLIGFVTLIVLLVDVASDGLSKLSWDFITSFPSSLPDRAGIQSPIVGTIYLMILVALITIPIGVGAAIYLEEYADKERWYNRAIEINIQNLAGGALDRLRHPRPGLPRARSRPRPGAAGGRADPHAARAADRDHRLARGDPRGPAVDPRGRAGARRDAWQMIRRQVLPAAIPGIATGSILALSRAIGETAPLILIGAIVFVPFNPDGLDSPFTALPIQIFNWTSRPQEEFQLLAAAAILVLLGAAADHERIRDLAPQQISA